MVFVEAKLSSPNDRKAASHPGWATYFDPSAFRADASTIAEAGLYELVRNWRIGIELAGDRRFVLLNLSPERLDKDAESLRPLLADGPDRVLLTRTWSEVVSHQPQWLMDFARERGAIVSGLTV